MGITQEPAKCCHGLKFRQLSEEVVDRVKYLFLDFIGVAYRGSQEDSSKSVYRFIREMDCGKRGGVIIGTRERAPFIYAALANGVLSHAIEMDDINNEVSLHPGVVILFESFFGISILVVDTNCIRGGGVTPTNKICLLT